MSAKVPAAVKDAIENFRAVGGFTVKPALPTEKSLIYDWGVRVEYVIDGRPLLAWVCQADDSCRRSNDSLILLSSGRTSKATRHLRLVHQITSEKTVSEQKQKRKREDEIEHLRSSSLFINNPRRFNLLLETLRIVNHNLPFLHGEYSESKIIEALMKRDDMRTTVNAKLVNHSIVELYASTRAEVIGFLETARLERFGSLTMMTDFWSCTVTRSKYLGLRVFAVDENFELKSVLLGVRKFNPTFSVRSQGIGVPFKAWLAHMLQSFGLQFADFFSASSDGGSDVKKLITKVLNLRWEWCLAHMAHAATKAACGMDVDVSSSKNPQLTELISRLKTTIYHVRAVEKAGDLFAVLCTEHTDGLATQLLGYTPARFLSITSAIKRVIQKWDALEMWYGTRVEQAERERLPPPSFPLKNDKADLVQILSLLLPITKVKVMCQAAIDNQVNVLLALYLVRLKTLKDDTALLDYRSTPATPIWIPASDLTPLARTTRKLLQQNLDDRFFCRYTDPEALAKCPYMLELQQRLHPNFKYPERSLSIVVRLCVKQKGGSASDANSKANEINAKIDTLLRDLMIEIADPSPPDVVNTTDSYEDTDEVTRTFGMPSHRLAAPANRRVNRVDDELKRWRDDPSGLRSVDGKPVETVLDFWRRMNHTGEYRILPKVARILFAMPASSAHIERDFSVCGEMVSPQRTRLAPPTVDMCTFLNRNSEYVDFAQCSEIAPADLKKHIPAPVPQPTHSLPEGFFEDMEFDTIIGPFSEVSVTEGSL